MYGKATLVIKNIQALYTCESAAPVLHHAFLAAYHDRIIDFGTGDYSSYIDHATCVIDAAHMIVIPAFIDGLLDIPANSFRFLPEKKQVLHWMKRNGILTVLSANPAMQEQLLDQEVLVNRRTIALPVVSTLNDTWNLDPDEPFLLSCQYGKIPQKIYSLQNIAYSLYTSTQIPALNILQAGCAWPAQAFGLEKQGILARGSQCDLLIIQAGSVEEYFSISGMNPIRYMFKRGVMIYPYWRRV